MSHGIIKVKKLQVKGEAGKERGEAVLRVPVKRVPVKRKAELQREGETGRGQSLKAPETQSLVSLQPS